MFSFQEKYQSLVPIHQTSLLQSWQHCVMPPQSTPPQSKTKTLHPISPTIISSPATPIIPTLAPFDQHLDDTDNTLSSDTYSSSVPTEQIAIVNDEQDVVEQVTEEEVQGNTHPLTTRSKDGIHKPNPRYSLASKFETQEPKSINDALKHPGWNNAVNDEMRTLHMLDTWTLVRPTEDRNIFGCKWVFKTKFKPDETVEKLKARLVAK